MLLVFSGFAGCAFRRYKGDTTLQEIQTAILGLLDHWAGSLLFRALASRAGNFEKLTARNCL